MISFSNAAKVTLPSYFFNCEGIKHSDENYLHVISIFQKFSIKKIASKDANKMYQKCKS